MKKSLVLAMAMALGVTASAYAANPFSDVPAGHWAYDSISKLAAAGVIEGYGDTTFGGDKLMTRYEMAQIVAKAMAKGANVDKLAAEFADELDNLGVRVANLEKKADNVKITGQVRFRYNGTDYSDDKDKGDTKALRTRLWVAGQVNEDWTYTGMLQSTQKIDDNAANDTIDLTRAYVDGRVGGLLVHAGRWDECTSTANVLDADLDGVKVSYGDKVKVYGMAAKAASGNAQLTEKAADRLYMAGLETKVGVVGAYANYFKAEKAASAWDDEGEATDWKADNKEIFNVGVNFDVAKDLNLAYEYMWGNKKVDERVSKDGFVATLAYKGADAATPGTWGVSATYYDQPVNAFLSPTTDAETFKAEGGYKGWGVVANYALAKNIVAELSYYDIDAKATNDDAKLIYADLYFTF